MEVFVRKGLTKHEICPAYIGKKVWDFTVLQSNTVLILSVESSCFVSTH